MNKPIIQLAIVGVILIGLITIWVLHVYIPVTHELHKLKEEEKFLQGKLDKEITIDQVHVMKNAVDTLKKEHKKLLKRFFPAEDLIDLGKSIEQIGNQYGLQMNIITPEYSQLTRILGSNPEPVGLPIEVEFLGSFTQCTQFLDHIDQFPLALRVNEIKMIVEHVGSTNLDFIIKGIIFIKREQKDQTNTDKENQQEDKSDSKV